MSEHHHHHHHHDISGKNLFITIILNVIITISQIVGGVLSGSLALLSDAMHNFSDVVSLLIAYVANRLAAKPHTYTKTFGYKRAETLAALFNASMLVGIGVFLIIEAVDKFLHPEAINSMWVIFLGLLSIVLNALSLLLVKDDAHKNINIKAAYLHLLTDVMTSAAVVLGGLCIYFFDFFWLDPLVSIFIAFYLIWASFDIVKESVSIIMHFTPDTIDLGNVIHSITELKEIKNAHHVHMWRLDDHHIHLEAHLDFHENLTLEESNNIIDNLENKLHNNFEITHATFQCEFNRNDDKSIIALSH